MSLFFLGLVLGSGATAVLCGSIIRGLRGRLAVRLVCERAREHGSTRIDPDKTQTGVRVQERLRDILRDM